VTTEKLAGMAAFVNQNQQRVAVGPGKWHFISVRQVSYDVATMQRGTCEHAVPVAQGKTFLPENIYEKLTKCQSFT